MKIRILVLSGIIFMLTACVGPKPIKLPKIYDLGSIDVTEKRKVLPPIAIAEVDAPNWLDGAGIVYRLAYKNEQELNNYAYSQLATSPANLTEDKLREHLMQSAEMAIAGIYTNENPTLKIRLEDFSQTFTSPEKSYVRIVFSATVFKSKNIIAQKSFATELPAPTPNAEGAVKAFSKALDTNIENLIQWMITLNLK